MKQGLAISPNDPLARFYLAQALWAQGDRDSAVDEYKMSLAIDKGSSVASYAQARVEQYETERMRPVVAGRTYRATWETTYAPKPWCTVMVARTVTIKFSDDLLSSKIERIRDNHVNFDENVARESGTSDERQGWRRECLDSYPPKVRLVYRFSAIWGGKCTFTLLESNGVEYPSNTQLTGSLEALESGNVMRLHLNEGLFNGAFEPAINLRLLN